MKKYPLFVLLMPNTWLFKDDWWCANHGASWYLDLPNKAHCSDIAEVFMSRSGYFNRPRLLFPKLNLNYQRWWNGWSGEDAPATKCCLGDKEPSFKNLKEILESQNLVRRKRWSERGRRDLRNLKLLLKGRAKRRAKPRRQGRIARGRLAPRNLIMMTSK